MKIGSLDELFEAAGAPPEPLDVTCARCGAQGTSETYHVEEGDEWECPACFERCEAQERKRAAAMKSAVREKP